MATFNGEPYPGYFKDLITVNEIVNPISFMVTPDKPSDKPSDFIEFPDVINDVTWYKEPVTKFISENKRLPNKEELSAIHAEHTKWSFNMEQDFTIEFTVNYGDGLVTISDEFISQGRFTLPEEDKWHHVVLEMEADEIAASALHSPKGTNKHNVDHPYI